MSQELLMNWQDAVKSAQEYKELEAALRARIIEEYFKNAPYGTTHLAAGNANLKLVRAKTFTTLTNKEAQEGLAAAIKELSGRGEAGALMAKRLVKNKLEFVKKEYDELPEEWKLYFSKFVTYKDASPNLEYIAPSEET